MAATNLRITSLSVNNGQMSDFFTKLNELCIGSESIKKRFGFGHNEQVHFESLVLNRKKVNPFSIV